MIISGGKIFLSQGEFAEGKIQIKDGKIDKISLKGEDTAPPLKSTEQEAHIDATGLYIIPGLVDIHLHGCVGYDFCDGNEKAFAEIARYEASEGITTIVPATMTLAEEELAKIFKTAGDYCASEANLAADRSTIRGINMEGPFVSMQKKGAQNGAYIVKPDMAFFSKMQQLSGNLIKQVAVAPEEDKNLAFIREAAQNTVVSLAHTMADYETARQAFRAGANHVTHLYNAMPPLHHRDPGVIGAAMEEKVYEELICDGIHVHPVMVRLAFQLFGADHICMISDSMMATGMPDGQYALGGQAVTVTGKKAVLADGTIAGSASNLMDCMRNAVLSMGIALEDALKACTITPAKSLGIDDVCGSILEGRTADMVFLDEKLCVKMVLKDGLPLKPME